MASKAPPARQRYESTHPVFSARLPQDLFDRIHREAAARSLTKSQFLATLLDDRIAPDLQLQTDRLAWPGWRDGYSKGFSQGAWRLVLWVCDLYDNNRLGQRIQLFRDALAKWEKDEQLVEYTRLIDRLVEQFNQEDKVTPQ